MINHNSFCDCLDCMKLFDCPQCNKKLLDQERLEIHQYWKHGSRPKQSGLDEFLK